ncbi:MAG: hypothetical protein KatS3mg076_2923 [Candidatus Binatia bacterium]|nr:MAG: hypothetical protein KatS3mg076_2923 [Candidatus Binatia bacterium]
MSETLKPWYAVATSHEDIREGRLAEAVFAANLWAVVQGTAPEVYLDREEFFRKMCLATGLSTMLRRVAGRLEGRLSARKLPWSRPRAPVCPTGRPACRRAGVLESGAGLLRGVAVGPGGLAVGQRPTRRAPDPARGGQAHGVPVMREAFFQTD